MRKSTFYLLPVFLLLPIFSLAQTSVLKGRVIDEATGEGLAYVSVICGDKSVATDIDGYFTLESPCEELKFSYIGYTNKIVKVETVSDATMSVAMSAATMELMEITTGDIPASYSDADYIIEDRSAEEGKKVTTFSSERITEKTTLLTAPSISMDGEKAPDDGYEYKPATTTPVTTTTSEVSDVESGAVNAMAGVLTAGEIHDFSKWNLWDDISSGELKSYQKTWSMRPNDRYSVQLLNKQGMPMIDWTVKLVDKDGFAHWTTRTDNTGKAELWAGLFELDARSFGKLKVVASRDGEEFEVKNAGTFQNGVNILEVDKACNKPNKLEVAFVVDATGSMGDEIDYLKAELKDIITNVTTRHRDLQVTVGSVFYRDHGDDYVVRHCRLDSNIHKLQDFVNAQSADGGGDFPEAVDDALLAAVNNLGWSDEAVGRIMFLLLDAPPHESAENMSKLKRAVKLAAEKGIRVVPITCSGIDKSTEYLMRSIALATNGTYVFLTDDSGIGGTHIKPTTDKFEVETLNEILVRIMYQFSVAPTCDNTIVVYEDDKADTLQLDELIETEVITHEDGTTEEVLSDDGTTVIEDGLTYSIFPNPTIGPFTLEVSKTINEIFITDLSGKIIQRIDPATNQRFAMDISSYPSGLYFVKFSKKDKWYTEKIILVRN